MDSTENDSNLQSFRFRLILFLGVCILIPLASLSSIHEVSAVKVTCTGIYSRGMVSSILSIQA